MKNNPNQPRKDDAVLGGQAPPPVGGVVLGGIEGVKRRLGSAIASVRVDALSDALKYGDAGLDLVIKALKDEAEQVRHSAGLLLRKRTEIKARQGLLEHDPWLFFTTFANWKIEDFDPQIGITDTVGTAYALDFDRFEIILKDPQACALEALRCLIRYDPCKHESSSRFVDALFNAQDQLISLKAAFIGDAEEDEYMKSWIVLSDISPVLEAYPNLEVLQVRGGWDLEFTSLRHDHLKTLILETGYGLNRKTIAQICTLELPALEYLELWLGRDDYYYEENISINHLMPIISGELFPDIRYLGLRSSDYSDAIAEAVVDSPIIDRLMVLDLSMGALSDKGAEALLNCPAINRLHTLNVSRNGLSPDMVEQLSQLKCRVIAEGQHEEAYYRYEALTD